MVIFPSASHLHSGWSGPRLGNPPFGRWQIGGIFSLFGNVSTNVRSSIIHHLVEVHGSSGAARGAAHGAFHGEAQTEGENNKKGTQ